jgi:hypothetical protein
LLLYLALLPRGMMQLLYMKMVIFHVDATASNHVPKHGVAAGCIG